MGTGWAQFGHKMGTRRVSDLIKPLEMEAQLSCSGLVTGELRS